MGCVTKIIGLSYYRSVHSEGERGGTVAEPREEMSTLGREGGRDGISFIDLRIDRDGTCE